MMYGCKINFTLRCGNICCAFCQERNYCMWACEMDPAECGELTENKNWDKEQEWD